MYKRQVLTVGIGAEIEKLAFAHHGFAAAGDYTAALGVNAEDNKINFCAQHIAQQLHLANGHTVGTVGSAGGDHHFFERNDDAEAVVIHDSNRLAAVGLLDTTQRCRKDTPRAVGVVNLVPGSSFEMCIRDSLSANGRKYLYKKVPAGETPRPIQRNAIYYRHRLQKQQRMLI